jgi:hypothetical protein
MAPPPMPHKRNAKPERIDREQTDTLDHHFASAATAVDIADALTVGHRHPAAWMTNGDQHLLRNGRRHIAGRSGCHGNPARSSAARCCCARRLSPRKPYCRPPLVHKTFSPRAIFSGEPCPTLRSKLLP